MYSSVRLWEKFEENYTIMRCLLSVIDLEQHPLKHSAVLDKVYSDFLNLCEDVEKNNHLKLASYLYNKTEHINTARLENSMERCDKIMEKIRKRFQDITTLPDMDFPVFETYEDYFQDVYKYLNENLNPIQESVDINTVDITDEEEAIFKNIFEQQKEMRKNNNLMRDKVLKFIEKKGRKPHKSVKEEYEMAIFSHSQKNDYHNRNIDYDILVYLFPHIRV